MKLVLEFKSPITALATIRNAMTGVQNLYDRNYNTLPVEQRYEALTQLRNNVANCIDVNDVNTIKFAADIIVEIERITERLAEEGEV